MRRRPSRGPWQTRGVIAGAASQTQQAEAMRNLALKRAEYEQSVKQQQAQTDKAYDIRPASGSNSSSPSRSG
jgi:hypothetical protein